MTAAGAARRPAPTTRPAARPTSRQTARPAARAAARSAARPASRPAARPNRWVAGTARLRLAPPAVTRPSQGAFVLLVSVLLGVGLLGLLALNTVLAQGSFVAHDLTTRVDDLHDREEALQQEVAVLESPERLAARAREIGLVPGVNPVFLRPADGRILGVPTPARTPAARAGAAR